jgi:CBS domain-containing protein
MDRGLIECPYCGAKVIQGSDHCDACRQPLDNLHLPAPASEVELALLTDRVGIFQRRQALCVSPDIAVREAMRLLVYNRVGCVVVVDKGQVCGIFTERDVLMKLNDRARELGDHPVSEFMTTSVESLPPTAKIAFAVHRMDIGGYRHVPIVNEKNEPVGLFSVRDILRYLTGKIRQAGNSSGE